MSSLLPMGEREKSLLRTMPFISSLIGEASDQMVESASGVHCEARDIIFRQNEPSDFFYCVLSGYVRLYRLNRDGREADIRLCGPEDTFAECVLYAEGGYRYNAQATDTTLLCRFETRSVRRLAERYGAIDKAMVGVISGHFLESMDCIANDRLQTAPQRVANYLLNACEGSVETAQFRLPFPKSLLAGKLGLAPEALSRAFSTLRDSGVTVHGRLIEISNPEALRNV